MVDLYTALKLIDINDEAVIYLRKPEDTPSYRAQEILTVRDIKNLYDMKKTKVEKIAPCFLNNEYEGFLLTITN